MTFEQLKMRSGRAISQYIDYRLYPEATMFKLNTADPRTPRQIHIQDGMRKAIERAKVVQLAH